MDRVQWQIQSWSEGLVESPFDLKFHLHWKFFINLIDFGHFSFYFSSKSQQILNFSKIEWQTVFCSILSGSTLFAQA